MVLALRRCTWVGVRVSLIAFVVSVVLGAIKADDFWIRIVISVVLAGLAAALVPFIAEQLYFQACEIKASLTGRLHTFRDISIVLKPIRVSGVWQIAIDSSQNIEMPMVIALNGSLAGTSIGRMTSNSSARKGQISGKVRCTKVRIAVSRTVPPDTELEVRFKLRYDPPEIVRSFRLNKVLHGQPMDAQWTVCLRGPCTVHEFPSQATMIERSEGFLVIPVRAIPADEPPSENADQIN